MNKDSSPASGTSSTAWILLTILALALGAGAMAYWTMDGASHFSAPENTAPAQQEEAAPVVLPSGTVQGAISARLEESPPSSPERGQERGQEKDPATDPATGPATDPATGLASSAPQAPDQAGKGEAGKDSLQGGETGDAGRTANANGTAPASGLPAAKGQQDGAVPTVTPGAPVTPGTPGAPGTEVQQAQSPEPLNGNAPGDLEGQSAGQAAGRAAATGAEGGAGQEEDSGTILYGKGKAVNGGHSAVRGDIPPGQKPFGRPGAPARPGRGDTVVSLAFIDDFASFLADNYWPEGSHPMARGRGFSTASAKLTNMRYGMRLEGFSVNRSDPAKARHQVLAYAYMPSMLRALYGLYGDALFQSLENQVLDRASGPQGVYFTNAQAADFFSTHANMARAIGACAVAFRDKSGIRTQAESYARAQDEANAAYAHFINSLDAGEEGRHLASAAYYEAVRKRESGSRQLAIALGREGGNGLEADSRVYLALWLLRRGPENMAALSTIQELCLDGARRLDELAGRYKSLPGRQIARP